MKKAILFIFLTFIISWTLWGIGILAQEKILPSILGLFGMFAVFGPFIAFLVLSDKPLKKSFKKIFIKADLSVYILVILIPFLLSGLSYLIYYFTTATPEPIEFNIIVILVTSLVILFIGGPIEEFGWRGYLQPILRKKYSFIIVSIIVGVVHGVWHLPLHFLEGTVQSNIPILEFMAITILTAFFYSYIFEKTTSIIPMITLHLTANVSNVVFPYYYTQIGRYSLFIFYVIFDIIIIFLYYKKVKNNVFN